MAILTMTDAEFVEGVRCVVMPCCGFPFDARHTDEPDGKTYTCPICNTKPRPQCTTHDENYMDAEGERLTGELF